MTAADRKRIRLIAEVRALWIQCAAVRGKLDALTNRLGRQVDQINDRKDLDRLGNRVATQAIAAFRDDRELAQIEAWCHDALIHLPDAD